MIRYALIIAGALLLSGCATTPYQPFHVFSKGGYTDQRISQDRFKVAYYGNHLTSIQTLNSLLLYRSAEIALNNGFNYFEVIGGLGKVPQSQLGGFRSVHYTIKLLAMHPVETRPNVHVAEDVKRDFNPNEQKAR